MDHHHLHPVVNAAMAGNSNSTSNSTNMNGGLASVTHLPSEDRGWEYKQICVTRVQGYGFGIAVSGGRDNPHFASGDPSIAVSDVLTSGPAERILQVNDRIMSVNGISLQDVDYATAVQVLRDSGDTVTLVVKRRTMPSRNHHHSHSFSHVTHNCSTSSAAAVTTTGGGPPPHHTIPPPNVTGSVAPTKITLVRSTSKKKGDFGIVLGCKLYVKEISLKAREHLASTNQVLVEGDYVTKINSTQCHDSMSLKEARKVLDSIKDTKLQLTIMRDFSQMHQPRSISGIGMAGPVSPSSNMYSNAPPYYKDYSANSSAPPTMTANPDDDFLMTSGYSNQNLYVQPPTRQVVAPPPPPTSMHNTSHGAYGEDQQQQQQQQHFTKSLTTNDNDAPKPDNVGRGVGGDHSSRIRGPLSEANLNQLDSIYGTSTNNNHHSGAANVVSSSRNRSDHSSRSLGLAQQANDEFFDRIANEAPSKRANAGTHASLSFDGHNNDMESDQNVAACNLPNEADDSLLQQKFQDSMPEPRFISFQKEGSVGIRLTGGNFVGIFVTAVQPGSPASLQGLQPGDKILKVNEMDMNGVTREEAVLFLLSLQDHIDLIVQHCQDEYENVMASQKGDSFYIKTHFHYDTPSKGEMAFRSGDVFHVVDTLHNGVVGCWQVYRIGRQNTSSTSLLTAVMNGGGVGGGGGSNSNNTGTNSNNPHQQSHHKGVIPNKARAEELATAQFNANKKEVQNNGSGESRAGFFRRRRSNNRRSKSLGKEHWDDILFSDTVSKFPAYERVVLKHTTFTRPVVIFGPVSDIAREKCIKDFPDKFISPQLGSGMTGTIIDDSNTKGASSKTTGNTTSNTTTQAANIIRLSSIRDVISTGKHALLDITPNAVERLNYAQLYPIVIFLKADNKAIIKQLRHGLPKTAHKSSRKLLEQCQKVDKVWSHIFNATVELADNAGDNWYHKVREIIDKQQSNALWVSESKPEESLADDFLFPMSSLRLSYASSPESDVEHSPGPSSDQQALYGSQHVAGSAMTRDNHHHHQHHHGHLKTSNSNITATEATTLATQALSNALTTMTTALATPRLTKSSSDPSVVMSDCATDILPPYQANYDGRYGFNQHNSTISFDPSSMPLSSTPPPPPPPVTNHSHNMGDGNLGDQSAAAAANSQQNYLASSPLLGSSALTTHPTPHHNKSSLYAAAASSRLNDIHHRRQNSATGIASASSAYQLHQTNVAAARNQYSFSEPNSLNTATSSPPAKEGGLHTSQSQQVVPDIPPRVDRAIKPLSFLNSPSKSSGNSRSAHERLFGSKPVPSSPSTKVSSAENEQNQNDANVNYKYLMGSSSLDRMQNANADSPSCYDSFSSKNQSHSQHQHSVSSPVSSAPPTNHIGPNAHDDLKTTLSKSMGDVMPPSSCTPPTLAPPPPPNAPHLMSTPPRIGDHHNSPQHRSSYNHHQQHSHHNNQYDGNGKKNGMDLNDIYRGSDARSPPSKKCIETKTDYGKYSRNNSNAQDYVRSPIVAPPLTSQPDPSSFLGYHSPSGQQISHHAGMQPPPPPSAAAHCGSPKMLNGYDSGANMSHAALMHSQQSQLHPQHPSNHANYRPVPPPKPKNYKPPFTGNGNPSSPLSSTKNGLISNHHNYEQHQQLAVPPYHGKSYSNPVDPRAAAQPPPPPPPSSSASTAHHNGYYYTNNSGGNPAMPWQSPDLNSRYNGSNYDLAPPTAYESTRRHPNISYASRSEIPTMVPTLGNHQYDGSTGGGAGGVNSNYYYDGQQLHQSNGGGNNSSMNNRHNYQQQQQQQQQNNGNGMMDLQSTREQRGSAFELYRKPMHNNLR